jgi:hypothetical protein
VYSLNRYFGRKVQLGPANRRQKLGLVWRNRKKISQIINDYLCLSFFLLIILCPWYIVKMYWKMIKLLLYSGELPGARAGGHHAKRHQAGSRPALPQIPHGDKASCPFVSPFSHSRVSFVFADIYRTHPFEDSTVGFILR